MVVAEGGLLESYGQEEGAIFFDKRVNELLKISVEAFVTAIKLDPTQIRKRLEQIHMHGFVDNLKY